METKELIEILRDESNCNVLDYVDEAADRLQALSVALEMARKEHTALLADIKYVGDKCNGDTCFICKFFDPENEVCVCLAHCTGDYWEWRGVNPDAD